MDKGIVVSEGQIITAMDGMCAESLPPDIYDAWERVMDCLRATRSALLADKQGQVKTPTAPSE